MKYTNSESGKKFLTKKRIIKLSILLAIIALLVWDIGIDPPAFWHFRQADKQAIVQYQRQHYPGAKVVGSYFPFLGNPGLVGVPVESRMTFEYDDVEFVITAQNGEISVDGYYRARATAQFNKIIQEGFFKPRNITASVNYLFDESYKTEYPYVGDLGVEISISDQGSRPRDLAIYEFYKFWQNEGTFLKDYRVDFYIYENHEEKAWIVFNKETAFSAEDDFYSAIERNKGILIDN